MIRREPEVSIVIPAHDEAHRLALCLEPALRAAEAGGWEVVVVDDGSADSTSAVARDLGARTIRLEPAHGVAVARNRGAGASRGRILLFLDADVVAPVSTLQRLVDTLRSDPGIHATGAVPAVSDLNPSWGARLVGLRAHMPFAGGGLRDIRGFSSFQSECGAIRSEVFEALGGFSERFAGVGMEEFHLGHQLEHAGYVNVLLCDVTYQHHYKDLVPRCRELVHRTRRWVPLLVRRRRLESVGAVGSPRESASCALSWILWAGAAPAVVLPLAWPLVGGAAVAQLALERRFFRLALREYGPGSMLLAWPALQMMHAAVGIGFVAGLMTSWQSRLGRTHGVD